MVVLEEEDTEHLYLLEGREQERMLEHVEARRERSQVRKKLLENK